MGSKDIKETGEIVFFNDRQVDSITTPTKGPTSITQYDEIKLTNNSWNFNGLAIKNQGTSSFFKGRKIHKLNKRGKISDLYTSKDKSIIFKI